MSFKMPHVLCKEPLAKGPKCASNVEEIFVILREECDIISHYCSRFEFPWASGCSHFCQSSSFSNFEANFQTEVVQNAVKSFIFLVKLNYILSSLLCIHPSTGSMYVSCVGCHVLPSTMVL